MRLLALGDVVELHRRLLEQSGGATGIRDLGLLEAQHTIVHVTRQPSPKSGTVARARPALDDLAGSKPS